MAKSIMIQGTMSNSGKSFLTAGLCRIFTKDGYETAPFKSQNMANNSFVTKEGLEIGRAQAVQAMACRKEPVVDMNPVLLKPNSDMGSQVIIGGRVYGNMKAAEYFKYKSSLIPHILRAYENLSKKNDIIVIEGAGSPAEINLKDNDIVNMGLAKLLSSPVLLVGDIDRGGVFASLYGTVKLLEKEERARIKGLIINKFRGDMDILKPGIKMIEDLLHIPVLGTIPMISVDLEDEDSLAPRLDKTKAVEGIDIAVIRLPHISNFTDFNILERIQGVSLRYVQSKDRLGTPDLIIIPGSKSSIADLLWMRKNGIEERIKRFVSNGGMLIGICGGFQMLGKTIEDRYEAEYGGGVEGMGFLDAKTYFEKEKLCTNYEGYISLKRGGGCKGEENTSQQERFFIKGYEIHMGKTVNLGNASDMTEEKEGCKGLSSKNGQVWGSYIHGIFDNEEFTEEILKDIAKKKGYGGEFEISRSNAYREEEFDKLADLIRANIDMKKIYRIMEIEQT